MDTTVQELHELDQIKHLKVAPIGGTEDARDVSSSPQALIVELKNQLKLATKELEQTKKRVKELQEGRANDRRAFEEELRTAEDDHRGLVEELKSELKTKEQQIERMRVLELRFNAEYEELKKHRREEEFRNRDLKNVDMNQFLSLDDSLLNSIKKPNVNIFGFENACLPISIAGIISEKNKHEINLSMFVEVLHSGPNVLTFLKDICNPFMSDIDPLTWFKDNGYLIYNSDYNINKDRTKLGVAFGDMIGKYGHQQKSFVCVIQYEYHAHAIILHLQDQRACVYDLSSEDRRRWMESKKSLDSMYSLSFYEVGTKLFKLFEKFLLHHHLKCFKIVVCLKSKP